MLLLPSLASLNAAEAPKPESPAAGAITYSPHPHFRWQREVDVGIDEVHRIQVARDEAFAEMVCDDRLEVVSRFVSVRPLPPCKYWWRVRRGDGDWSQAAAFEVRAPERAFSIRAGSDEETVARVLREAAVSGPARVDFEPGKYALSVHDRTGLATLEKAHDLIIDGNGAELVLAGETCSLQSPTNLIFSRTPHFHAPPIAILYSFRVNPRRDRHAARCRLPTSSALRRSHGPATRQASRPLGLGRGR